MIPLVSLDPVALVAAIGSDQNALRDLVALLSPALGSPGSGPSEPPNEALVLMLLDAFLDGSVSPDFDPSRDPAETQIAWAEARRRYASREGAAT